PFVSHVLLLLSPCLLIFPLFPYTTLFRSHDAVAVDVRHAAERGRVDHIHVRVEHLLERVDIGRGEPVRGRRRVHVDGGARERAQDRKSTRLNSSHEWISYAVFCLKKKKDT